MALNAPTGPPPTPASRLARRIRAHHAIIGPRLGCAEDNEEFDPALTADGEGVYCATCSMLLFGGVRGE